MKHFSYLMFVISCVFCKASLAYENQCELLFNNGVGSHLPSVVTLYSYASIVGGNAAIDADSINGWGKGRACGGTSCYATGNAAAIFPEFVPFDGWTSSGSTTTSGLESFYVGPFSSKTLNSNGETRLSSMYVSSTGSLALMPGDYWVDTLSLGMFSKITLAAPGQVRIFARSVHLYSTSDFGSLETPFLVYTGEIEVEAFSEVNAFIYSVGDAVFDSNTVLNGAVSGDNVHLGLSATVNYLNETLANVNYGWICDYDNDGIYDGFDEDSDDDGFSNELEAIAGTDAYDANSRPIDTDGDGQIDILDDDIDGDGVDNDSDSFPTDPSETVDTDGDNIGNNADTDDDNDGYTDVDETTAGSNPLDENSIPNDLDGDGVSDSTDTDIDGDGVHNGSDAFPTDPSETVDTDGDNIGNNADTDDDNDGYTDADEVAAGSDPLDENSVPADNDGDFISDVTDTDDDNDGVADAADAFPTDPSETVDTDGDNIGNNADTDDDNDGYTDADEVAAGTDPLDENSVPADNDGDFISDVTDTDIDGDGYTNDEEAQVGSDPYNADSLPLTITIGSENNQQVYQNRFNLTGLVSSVDLSGISLRISSGSDSTLPVINDSGYFSQTLPLNIGVNTFDVIVGDSLGHQVTETFEITYLAPFNINSISPVSGSTSGTQTLQLNVSIEVLSGSAPQVRVGDVTLDILQNTDSIVEYQGEITLLPGENALSLTAVSSNKSVIQDVNYRYTPEDNDDYAPPVFVQVLPDLGHRTASSTISVYAKITSSVGRLSGTINGVDVSISNQSGDNYVLATEFPVEEGINTIEIAVTDALNQTEIVTREVEVDRTGPEIVFDSQWLALPQLNETLTPSVNVSGRVLGDDVASLKINGVTVNLSSSGGEYSFNTNVLVPAETETLLQFSAKDDLGNKTLQDFYFSALSSVQLEWITPEFPVIWYVETGTGYPFAVQLIDGTGEEELSAVLLPDNINLPLQRLGDLATGTFPADLSPGDYTIKAVVSFGVYEYAIEGSLNVISREDIPLEIVSTEPSNLAEGIEPDSPIIVNFNRPVDPAAMGMEIKRTLHGKTYINKDMPGTSFLQAKGQVLEDVNISRQSVQGGMSLVNGDTTLVFYPEADLGYGAEIYWEVLSNGEVVGRQYFTTRDLPTYIEGGVVDTLGQVRADLTVEIKELGIRTKTNNDGGYAFGYGSTAATDIPEGEYHLVVNPDGVIPELGVVSIPVSITGSIRNKIPLLHVPNKDLSIPEVAVSTTPQKVRLAQGAVTFNFSGGEIEFPSEQHTMHAQFIPMSSSVRELDEGLSTFWVYQLQPFGITPLEGVEVELELPAYKGGFEYLPNAGDNTITKYVLMVGYNPDKDIIEAVGLAEITGTTLTSVGAIDYATLDYIGYSSVLPIHEPYIEQYLNNTMSFIALVSHIKTERP